MVTKPTYDLGHMQPDPFSYLPAKACRTIDMQKGDTLFAQNQTTSGLYRVVSGCVTLQRTGLGGDTLILHRAISGGFFAEASIFSQTYHCDAICTQSGSVVKIAKSDVVLMMHSNPAFCEGFTRLLAAVQAGYHDATVTELASRINLSQEACYRALRGLCQDGRMVQTGRGAYALA